MMYVDLSVDSDTLNDFLVAVSHQTYDYWKSSIERNYPSIAIVDHPIVKSFKFFTSWPGTHVFYVNPENNRVAREVLVVRSKFYSEKMHEEIDFDKAILLGVFTKSTESKLNLAVTFEQPVVRYALAPHNILPYRFNE